MIHTRFGTYDINSKIYKPPLLVCFHTGWRILMRIIAYLEICRLSAIISNIKVHVVGSVFFYRWHKRKKVKTLGFFFEGSLVEQL